MKTSFDRLNMDKLSVRDFRHSYLLTSTPVIITNIFKGISPLVHWTPELIAKTLNNKIVRINTSTTGTFSLNSEKGGLLDPSIEMSFKKYLKKIQNPKNTEILYMQQLSIINELTELKNKFVLPKYVNSPKQIINDINLWFGPGGNTSPLHYDEDNNFFIQSYGVKKFLIFNPWDFYNLYPHPMFSMAPHTSKINPIDPNVKLYPKFSKAQPMEIIIQPGEMLFLPAYWWHQVYSMDVTISINIWCPPLRRQFLVPGALHFLLNNWYYSVKNFIESKMIKKWLKFYEN